MLPTDPKEAAKLGKAFGETLSDSVFGIADDLRKVKAKNQAIAARNEIIKINNQIAKNNQLLRKQAMQELAAEQEAQALARMNPAQREAYKKAKAKAALDERNKQIDAENMRSYIIAGLIILALVAIAGAIAFAVLRIH